MIDTIVGIVGIEGSGKSCLMTYLSLAHIVSGGVVRAFPGYRVQDPEGRPLSEELPLSQWLALPPDLKDLLIDADELQNWVNSRRHMSRVNQFLGGLLTQRRKRRLGFMYTTQFWKTIDASVRDLTHVLMICQDLAWTHWGEEEGLEEGEVLSYSMWDTKGKVSRTGEPWTYGGTFLLRARPIWPCYDTYATTELTAGMAKVNIKQPEYTLDYRGVRDPGYDYAEAISAAGAEDLAERVGRGEDPRQFEQDTALLDSLARGGADAKTLARLSKRLGGR